MTTRKIFLILAFLLLSAPAFSGVTFDALDDSLTCGTGDDVMTENGAVTVYAVFNATSAGEGSQGNVYGKNASGSNGPKLMMASTGAVRWLVNDNLNQLDRVTNTSLLSYGVPHKVVATWDGSTTASNVHIYIDGTEATYATTTNGASLDDNSGSTHRIGANSSGSTTFEGTIYEVAAWNVVLTAQEIAQLSTSNVKRLPLQIQPSALKRYWALDAEEDGTSADGDTFRDLSSTGATSCTGVDGANNTGLTATAEQVLTYP